MVWAPCRKTGWSDAAIRRRRNGRYVCKEDDAKILIDIIGFWYILFEHAVHNGMISLPSAGPKAICPKGGVMMAKVKESYELMYIIDLD